MMINGCNVAEEFVKGRVKVVDYWNGILGSSQHYTITHATQADLKKNIGKDVIPVEKKSLKKFLSRGAAKTLTQVAGSDPGGTKQVQHGTFYFFSLCDNSDDLGVFTIHIQVPFQTLVYSLYHNVPEANNMFGGNQALVEPAFSSSGMIAAPNQVPTNRDRLQMDLTNPCTTQLIDPLNPEQNP